MKLILSLAFLFISARAMAMDPEPTPAPSPTPAPLTCEARVTASQQDPSLAGVKVWCSESASVSVAVYEKNEGNILCLNDRFAADTDPFQACNFHRDPSHRLEYVVRVHQVRTGNLLYSHSGMLFKGPTYTFPPQGQLLSDRLIKPPMKPKAFNRGVYWPFAIEVSVADLDVDKAEGQSLINVEAIVTNSQGTKTVSIRSANTEERVQFYFEHHFIKPLFGGQPHDSNEGFVRGENTVVIRVHDAYNGALFVDLPAVTVVIQGQ